MSRRGRNVTIREGTSERHWYAIAGYCALALIGLGVTVAGAVQDGAVGGTVMAASILLVLLLATLPVGWALFKDSAYVRGVGRWRPRWWYYLGAPVGVAGGVYAALTALAPTIAPVGMALMSYVAASVMSNALYLYRRHQIVGVP